MICLVSWGSIFSTMIVYGLGDWETVFRFHVRLEFFLHANRSEAHTVSLLNRHRLVLLQD